MANYRFVIRDDGRRLAAGGPIKSEFYGPSWLICLDGDGGFGDPVVVIPDSGDGSAAEMALRILSILNSDQNQSK